MQRVKPALELVYKHRRNVALGLIGNPGVSKSEQVYQFAAEKKIKVVEIITSQDSPTEISGMAMPFHDEKRMGVYDFDRLMSLEDGDILFFDEFLNGHIQVLNACLTLVTQRMMRSGKKLPDVMVVAAGNEQGSANMLPQTKQRFMWQEVVFDSVAWSLYIENKYGFAPDQQIIKLIKGEMFLPNSWNYWTPRTAEQIIELSEDADESHPFWDSLYQTPSQGIREIAGLIRAAKKAGKLMEMVLDKDESIFDETDPRKANMFLSLLRSTQHQDVIDWLSGLEPEKMVKLMETAERKLNT